MERLLSGTARRRPYELGLGGLRSAFGAETTEGAPMNSGLGGLRIAFGAETTEGAPMTSAWVGLGSPLERNRLKAPL